MPHGDRGRGVNDGYKLFVRELEIQPMIPGYPNNSSAVTADARISTHQNSVQNLSRSPDSPTQPTESRVYSEREVSRSRDPLKEVGESTAFGFAETGADQLLVFRGDVLDLIEDALARLRQIEGIDAAIMLSVATLDESALLEVVEQSDQTARVHPQGGRHFVLADAGGSIEQPDDP
jgi:hypothetical protein